MLADDFLPIGAPKSAKNVLMFDRSKQITTKPRKRRPDFDFNTVMNEDDKGFGLAFKKKKLDNDPNKKKSEYVQSTFAK